MSPLLLMVTVYFEDKLLHKGTMLRRKVDGDNKARRGEKRKFKKIISEVVG